MNKKDSLGYRICTTARKIHHCLTARFEKYDITPEQWVILRTVFENEGLSQKQLAQLVDKDANNVKVLVDKLVKKPFWYARRTRKTSGPFPCLSCPTAAC